MPLSENAAAAQCLAYLEHLLRQQLTAARPEVVRLSIALGLVETLLTPKDATKRQWPQDLPSAVFQLEVAFDAFVDGLGAPGGCLATCPSPASKIKAVADAVWGKLTKGSYSKDLLHAQYVYNFAALLVVPANGGTAGPAGMPAAKRQLDCAGVVTTTYAACQALALRHPAEHADLAAVRMQISEDHCWLNLGADGGRETTVEVTTDTPAKRGLPVAPEAWAGWLYTGGRAVLCTPHQALAALVTSVNPAVAGGKKGGDSEELQAVQRRLLEVLAQALPASLYPAALCALADLKEVAAQDELEAARDAGDAAEVARLLRSTAGDPQALFERAIELAGGGSSGEDSLEPAVEQVAPAAVVEPAAAAGGHQGKQAGLPADGAGSAPSFAEVHEQPVPATEVAKGASASRSSGGSGAGRQWYPYSYLAASLAWRAEFLASCAGTFGAAGSPGQLGQPSKQGGHGEHGEQQQQQQQQQQPYWEQAVATALQGLQAASRGAAVLRRYRFSPSTDEQLYKDIEAVLDECFKDGLAAVAKSQPGGAPLEDPALLQPLLLLWDGICGLFAGRAKPSAWVGVLVKVAKLFSPAAREAAAAAVAPHVSSEPMLAARRLWLELKAVQIKPLFESADVGGGAGGSGLGDRAAKRQRA